jgi:hypothetical protein
MEESKPDRNIQAIEPLQIAADCLREALLKCDVPVLKAEQVKLAFICLKQSLDEDARDRLIRLASQYHNSTSTDPSDLDLIKEVNMEV